MKQVSLQKLRSECQRLGCSLELDSECQCYRATAPSGRCFESGLHELIAVFGAGFIGNGATRAAARADLGYRLLGYAALGSCDESCSVRNCDLCRCWETDHATED